MILLTHTHTHTFYHTYTYVYKKFFCMYMCMYVHTYNDIALELYSPNYCNAMYDQGTHVHMYTNVFVCVYTFMLYRKH